jgi:hypothetical protein
VKAGSGAERVVVVVPVEVPVVLVCVGVVWVLVGVVLDCVLGVVTGVSGALETVTVFVPTPHAPSSPTALASIAATLTRSALDLLLGPVPRILSMVFAARSGPPRLVGRACSGDASQPRAGCSRVADHRGRTAAIRIIISDC